MWSPSGTVIVERSPAVRRAPPEGAAIEDFRRDATGARELAGPARLGRSYPCGRNRKTFADVDVQITFSRTSRSSVPMTDRRIEPKHPSPLEKKTNIARA
jgi:hypothetical protein